MSVWAIRVGTGSGGVRSWGGTREAFLEEGRSPALPCKMIPEMAAGLVGAFFLVASRAWGVFGNTMGFTSNRMGWALARLSPAHR